MYVSPATAYKTNPQNQQTSFTGFWGGLRHAGRKAVLACTMLLTGAAGFVGCTTEKVIDSASEAETLKEIQQLQDQIAAAEARIAAAQARRAELDEERAWLEQALEQNNK